MLEREHPEDPLVMKCQACARVVGPPREHEEPAKESPRVTLTNGMRHGAMGWKEGCRCVTCVDAYQDRLARDRDKRHAKKGAAA